jgi:HEAT repeat protein
MALLLTRLPALLWSWFCAHKPAASILAIVALASLVAGLNILIPEPTQLSGDLASRIPAGNNEDAEQFEKWLAEGIDLSSLMKEAVPGHIKALKDEDPAVRLEAAKALGQIGSEATEAIPTLIHAVNDPDPEVAAKAIEALQRTDQRTAQVLRALLAAIKDSRADVRAAAAAALANMWWAEKGEPENRRAGRLGRQSEELARSAIPVLTAALRDKNARVRAQAAAALAEVGPLAKPAVDELIHLLQADSDPDVRLRATSALGSIGPEARAAVPVLVDQLRKNGICISTVVALGQIHSHPELAVPALVDVYLTSETRVAIWPLGALQNFGPAAAQFGIPILKKALKEAINQEDREVMNRAATALDALEKARADSKNPAAMKSSAKP